MDLWVANKHVSRESILFDTKGMQMNSREDHYRPWELKSKGPTESSVGGAVGKLEVSHVASGKVNYITLESSLPFS